MGTFDGSINKVDWKAAMEHDGVQLHTSVCNQDDPKDIFEVVAGSDDHQKQRPYGEMHCIEPMPRTYERLHYSAKALGYMEKGFTVTNAAVLRKSGDMFFPVDGKEGLENFGLIGYLQQSESATGTLQTASCLFAQGFCGPKDPSTKIRPH
jgi:hypothetical protein